MEQNPNKLFQREFETIDSVNGSTALLGCRMSKSLNPDQIFRISWLKMPRQLLTRGRMKITTNQRINFVPHTVTEDDTFQLKIDPVLQEDAGEYRCVYKENDAFHFKITILNVNGVFVRRGNFVISSTTRHMVGWYFCEAFNGVQPAAFAHALLSIHYAPSVSVSHRQIERAFNENVTLSCRFMAFPVAEIEWSLDGVTLDQPDCRPKEWQHLCAESKIENIGPHVTKPLEYALKNPLVYDAPSSSIDGVVSGNRTRFLFNLTASEHDLSAYGRPVESVLKIKGLRTKEFGTYACRMRNIRGVAEGYIRLKRRGITELRPEEIAYVGRIKSAAELPKAIYAKSVAPRAMANYRTSTTAAVASSTEYHLILVLLVNIIRNCVCSVWTPV
ncbi:unnamed protein product [Schistocephalus solidus]|uniref:Ig-like domain-containing protein n=1 Tax=Schistocephalus solidus TaxID=70667 RepID=A0A183SF34_SCHSO|nr:unnamed protein product [Schistocephalus solidus]